MQSIKINYDRMRKRDREKIYSQHIVTPPKYKYKRSKEYLISQYKTQMGFDYNIPG